MPKEYIALNSCKHTCILMMMFRKVCGKSGLQKVEVKMLALFQIYAQTITLLCSKIELLKTVLNTVVNSL